MSLLDRKPFQELQVGEKVYLLKPLTLQIQESTVVKSAWHPKSLGRVWVLEIYKPTELKVTDEAMKIAKEELGTSTTMQIFVEPHAYMATLMIKPQPSVLCTNKQILQKWTDTPDRETLRLLEELRKNV